MVDVWRSLWTVGLWFENSGSPVGTLGHEWVPERTPEGAERSGALGAKRRVVRTGSRVTIVPTEGTRGRRYWFRESAVIDYRRGWNGASFIRCKREELCYSALTPQKKRTDLWCHTKPALNPQPSI